MRETGNTNGRSEESEEDERRGYAKGVGQTVDRIFPKIMTSGCQLAVAYRCNPS